jgi:hypothetical protein
MSNEEQRIKQLRGQGQRMRFQERAESPNDRLRGQGYNIANYEAPVRNFIDPQQQFSNPYAQQQQQSQQQNTEPGWRDFNMNSLLMQRMNMGGNGFQPPQQQMMMQPPQQQAQVVSVAKGATLYTEINIGVQNPVALCKKAGDSSQTSQVTLRGVKQCYIVGLNEQRVDLQAINNSRHAWKQLVEVVTGMGQKYLVEQQFVVGVNRPQQQGMTNNNGMLFG